MTEAGGGGRLFELMEKVDPRSTQTRKTGETSVVWKLACGQTKEIITKE